MGKHDPAVTPRADASLTIAFERELDVVNFPFLRSHVIKGRAGPADGGHPGMARPRGDA